MVSSVVLISSTCPVLVHRAIWHRVVENLLEEPLGKTLGSGHLINLRQNVRREMDRSRRSQTGHHCREPYGNTRVRSRRVCGHGTEDAMGWHEIE